MLLIAKIINKDWNLLKLHVRINRPTCYSMLFMVQTRPAIWTMNWHRSAPQGRLCVTSAAEHKYFN